MPPRHVGVRGCFPEPWQSSAARRGASEAPTPKMLPGPSRAVLSPAACAAPEAGANPKQSLVLPGSVRVPAVLRDSVTRAGQVAVLLSLLLPRSVRVLRAQHPCCGIWAVPEPRPQHRDRGGIPLQPKSGFIITVRTDQPPVGAPRQVLG